LRIERGLVARAVPPGAGRRGEGDRLRAAGHAWPAARPLYSRRTAQTRRGARRDRRLGVDDLALATRRRAQALAAALLDLRARPGLPRESGARAGPIPAALRGTPVAARRPGDLRRREVPAAGARPWPRDRRRAAWPVRPWSSSSPAGAARWPTLGPGTSTTPACSTALSLRPGSSRSVGLSSRSGQRALRLGARRLLDRGQRLKPRRACLDRAARGRLAEPAARPPPDPRLLAQPDRALLLDRPAQGAQPNSFDSLDELADRLLRFGEHHRQTARPFDWTFTRADLERALAKITEREPRLALAA
jgi:hypothetical protein